MSASSKIKMQQKVILIADDHVIIRRGLKMLININFTSFRIIEASGISELMACLAERPITHLILDLQLADGNAMTYLPTIRKQYPDLAILVYSMNSFELFAKRIYAMGANIYISKQVDEREMLTQLDVFLNKSIEEYHLPPSTTLDNGVVKRLSERELLVAQGLAQGKSLKELAIAFELKPSTIATYKIRLFEKLGVKNIIEFKSVFDSFMLNQNSA